MKAELLRKMTNSLGKKSGPRHCFFCVRAVKWNHKACCMFFRRLCHQTLSFEWIINFTGLTAGVYKHSFSSNFLDFLP